MTEARAAAGWTALLVVILLGAALVQPGRVMPGDPTVDVWTHAWLLQWVAGSLARGELPGWAAQLAWPAGGRLTAADPLGAVLVAPLTLLAGPAIALTALTALQLGLSGAAGWRYGRALGGPWAGMLTATALVASPTFVSEIHNGVTEALWVGLVPAAGAAAIEGRRSAAAWALLAGLASPYHGVSATLLAGAHLAERRDLRGLVRVGLLGGLGIALAVGHLKYGFTGPSPLETKLPGIADPILKANAVDPRDVLWPGDHWTVPGDGVQNPAFRRSSYLGFILMGLSAYGLYLSRRWALLGVAAAGWVASLGPFLWWGTDFVTTAGGDRIGLPLLPLLLAVGGGVDHPLRFLGLTVAALGGLAAIGAGRRAPAFAVALLLELLLIAPTAWPLATSPASVPRVYATLPPSDLGIIPLPAAHHRTQRTGIHLYWQAHHGRPIPWTLKPHPDARQSNLALRWWASLSRGDAHAIPPTSAVDPSLKAAAARLREDGFSHVILHTRLCTGAASVRQHRQAIEALLGPPTEVGPDLLWALPEP